MNSSDIDLIKLGFTYGWPVILGVISYLWKVQNEKIESVRKDARTEVKSVREEVNRQRDNIAKLFDQNTVLRREAEARHIEMMRDVNLLLSQNAHK